VALNTALKALSLGLSSGVFCLGFCYPILGPLVLSRRGSTAARPLRGTALSLALFLGGRLAAYLLVGLATGLVGRRVQQVPLIQAVILPSLIMLLGVLLALYGLGVHLPHWRFCRWTRRLIEDRRFLLAAGFLAGINVCPPFLLAMSYTVGLGAVGPAVLFFAVFFLATSLHLLPFLLAPLLTRFDVVRKAARIAAVASGIWFLYLGIRAVVP